MGTARRWFMISFVVTFTVVGIYRTVNLTRAVDGETVTQAKHQNHTQELGD